MDEAARQTSSHSLSSASSFASSATMRRPGSSQRQHRRTGSVGTVSEHEVRAELVLHHNISVTKATKETRKTEVKRLSELVIGLRCERDGSALFCRLYRRNSSPVDSVSVSWLWLRGAVSYKIKDICMFNESKATVTQRCCLQCLSSRVLLHRDCSLMSARFMGT